MTDSDPDHFFESVQRAHQVDQICDAFEVEIRSGNRPSIEAFLSQVAGAAKQALLLELLKLEMHYRRLSGETIAADEYQDRFPGLPLPRLQEIIQVAEFQGLWMAGEGLGGSLQTWTLEAQKLLRRSFQNGSIHRFVLKESVGP